MGAEAGDGSGGRRPVPAVEEELGEEGAEHVDAELDREDDGEGGVQLVEEELERGRGVDVVVVGLHAPNTNQPTPRAASAAIIYQ